MSDFSTKGGFPRRATTEERPRVIGPVHERSPKTYLVNEVPFVGDDLVVPTCDGARFCDVRFAKKLWRCTVGDTVFEWWTVELAAPLDRV